MNLESSMPVKSRSKHILGSQNLAKKAIDSKKTTINLFCLHHFHLGCYYPPRRLNGKSQH